MTAPERLDQGWACLSVSRFAGLCIREPELFTGCVIDWPCRSLFKGNVILQ